MQKTARYIQDLSTELSQLASQHELRDLAYLLSLAAEEARSSAETGTYTRLPPPHSPDEAA
ncbi:MULTISPECIES: hypothetical protein [Kaistia]|jgi:hypothetical protein